MGVCLGVCLGVAMKATATPLGGKYLVYLLFCASPARGLA